MCNILIIISNVIIGLATVVIAIVSISNFRLAKALQKKSEQHEQRLDDLLNALVIAQLCAPHGGEGHSKGMQRFIRHYKGKTQILQNE